MIGNSTVFSKYEIKPLMTSELVIRQGLNELWFWLKLRDGLKMVESRSRLWLLKSGCERSVRDLSVPQSPSKVASVFNHQFVGYFEILDKKSKIENRFLKVTTSLGKKWLSWELATAKKTTFSSGYSQPFQAFWLSSRFWVLADLCDKRN